MKKVKRLKKKKEGKLTIPENWIAAKGKKQNKKESSRLQIYKSETLVYACVSLSPSNTTQQWQTDRQTHTETATKTSSSIPHSYAPLSSLNYPFRWEKKMKEKHLFFYYFLSRNLSNTLHSLSLELAFSFSLLSLLWLVYFCLVGVWVCACMRACVYI